jgi:PEP-CTERM motif
MWFRSRRQHRHNQQRCVALLLSEGALLFVAGAFLAPLTGNLAVATNMVPVTVINPARDKFGTPRTNNLEDVTISTVGAPLGALRIDGIDDLGPFTSNSPTGGTAVKVAGAAIPPGSSGTFIVDFNLKPARAGLGSFTVEGSFKAPPRQPVQTSMNFGYSDMIFSAAIFGGEAGVDFAGVSIPANQIGYFYELQWTGSGSGPQAFTVNIGTVPPTASGILNNTWVAANLLPTVTCQTDGLGNVVACNATLEQGMVPENLSGSPGSVPASWVFTGDSMVAQFSTPLATGDESAVLWFTDVLEPSLGGPLGLAAENAQLIGPTGDVLFAASAKAPAVPEPSTLFLVSSALAACIIFARRLRAVPTLGCRVRAASWRALQVVGATKDHTVVDLN